MSAKQIIFDDTARRKIQKGVQILAKAVRTTLGPGGRNVIFTKSYGGGTQFTKDGVTVSKEVELEDKFENMGAKLVNEVASKVNDEAGDGTTTATVLAEAIYSKGLAATRLGGNHKAIKNGIDKAVAAVTAKLAELSREVESKEASAQVATVSANHDRSIGDIVADAFEKVGKNGIVSIEEGKGLSTSLDLVDGVRFDKGYISPYFITDPGKMECILEDALVLFHEKKIANLKDFIPVLEQVAQTGRPLLVIAEDVEGESLAALILNKIRGSFKVCAVKAPGFGDRRRAMLEDMAVISGGRVIAEDLGVTLENVGLADLGTFKKIVVTKDNTVLIDGLGDEEQVAERKRQIQVMIDRSTSDYDKEKLQERLGSLSGGVAIIDVGGQTEAAMKERKMRIDDAVHATRAALEEGIVPGGGIALIHCIEAVNALELDDTEDIGRKIVQRCLETPLRQICENAGYDAAIVLDDLREKGGTTGFDVMTGEYVDMFEAGIIDPTKVVRTALECAASVAGTMLTTRACITELGDDEQPRESVII